MINVSFFPPRVPPLLPHFFLSFFTDIYALEVREFACFFLFVGAEAGFGATEIRPSMQIICIATVATRASTRERIIRNEGLETGATVPV